MEFETKISKKYLDKIMETEDDGEHIYIASRVANELILGASLYLRSRGHGKLSDLMPVLMIIGGEVAVQVLVASALSSSKPGELPDKKEVWEGLQKPMEELIEGIRHAARAHLDKLHPEAGRIHSQVTEKSNTRSYYDKKSPH
jgi:hypothetical protein